MLIMKDDDKKPVKRVYTGEEIIIAIGKKYEQLHEIYKPYYKTYFDIFDIECAFDKIPLFENETDFYNCLAAGMSDIYRIQNVNSKHFKNKDGKEIKINNIKELKRYRYNLSKPFWYFLSISLGITIGYLISRIFYYLVTM